MIDLHDERLDPAETRPTTGRAPEVPDVDLTGEEPTAAAKGSCFLMTDGHDGGGVSRERGKAARDDDWATSILRMDHRVMVSADATGGGGTRLHTRDRQFSFPLKLLLVKADFFHARSSIPPPLTLSTREKVLVKVKVVYTMLGV
jgi:hypothetical protein